MLTNTEIWLSIIPVLIIANFKLKGQLDSSKKVKFIWEFQKYPFSFKIAYIQICSIVVHWVDCLSDPLLIFFLTFVTRIHCLFNTNVTVVMVNQPCSRKIHKRSSPNLSLANFLPFASLIFCGRNKAQEILCGTLNSLKYTLIMPLTVLERQIDWKCLKNRGVTSGMK